jgi:Capsular polysaccharide biosynthesis protein
MDDGSRNVEQSLRMLRLSAAQGVDSIVATPHFSIRKENIQDFVDRRRKAYELIETACIHGYEGPKIYLGAEAAYFPGMSWYKNVSDLCIDGTSYMLLELPFEPWSKHMINEVCCLRASRGITPIIAHIERYAKYISSKENVSQLLDAGALMQMNTSFLVSPLTRMKSLKYLKTEKVHLLGSDCHNLTDRKSDFDAAIKIIRHRLGEAKINEIDVLGRTVLIPTQAVEQASKPGGRR